MAMGGGGMNKEDKEEMEKQINESALHIKKLIEDKE